MEFSLWFISLLFILTIAFEHWIRGIRTDCSWLRVGAWRDNPFQRLVVEPKCVTFFHIATSMQKLLWLFVVFVVGEILYPWLNLFVFARSISFFFCGSLNTHFLYGCYTRATCHKSKVPGLGMMRWEARVVGWAHFVPIWESQVYVAKIECVFCLFIVQVACS